MNGPRAKHQIPNTKHQRKSNEQIPKAPAEWEQPTWSMELLGYLELGAWSFGLGRPVSQRLRDGQSSLRFPGGPARLSHHPQNQRRRCLSRREGGRSVSLVGGRQFAGNQSVGRGT